jgi:hypothetical protein
VSHLEEFKAFTENSLAEGRVGYTVSKVVQTTETLAIIKHSLKQ